MNPELKEYCLNKLYEERARTEKNIEELHAQKGKLNPKDYETGQFAQERGRIDGLLNNAFAAHSKINSRIDEFKRDAVTGDCPNCGGKIDEENLRQNPYMKLCAKFQMKINNHK